MAEPEHYKISKTWFEFRWLWWDFGTKVSKLANELSSGKYEIHIAQWFEIA